MRPDQIPLMITRQWLAAHPDHVFVFGDNKARFGKKGAAALRDLKNAYGFITKRYPSYADDAYYKQADYFPIFEKELFKLKQLIMHNPGKTYLISKLGAGLANKYHIWEQIIEPGLRCLAIYPNVVFLFK